ncbi:MAG: histidine kinase [Flavobacteriales bacterium]|nr:histidine kinase [Flavobacteriales bacterium]
MLRTQMNPHFIFNALNSINSYVQENERDLASGFLTKFARLMRLVLENSRYNEVPLEQDLDALRLYIELEQVRTNGKFDYSIEVDAAIDQAETMVPPLVMQPFVENAIWHGISRKEGKGHIKLIVRKYPNRLTMSVEDDGVGRGASSTHPAPDGAPPKSSLGTTITQDRLSLLGKQRGGEAGFRFMDLEPGTRVEVELPIQDIAR